MKKFQKLCFLALAVLTAGASLSVRGARAITPRQLAAPSSAGERQVSYASFGGNDLAALLEDGERPLSQVVAKIVLPAARDGSLPPAVAGCLDRIRAFALRVTERGKGDDEGSAVFAGEIDGELPEVPGVPASAAQSFPEGASILPAGTCVLNGDDVYFAFLSRGGGRFLLAARGDPSLLSAMAVAPEETPPEAPRAGNAPVWAAWSFEPTRLSKIFREDFLPKALSTPLRAEAVLDQTDSSIRAHVRVNAEEFFGDAEVPRFDEKPLLIGGDSLCALLSFEGLNAVLAAGWKKLVSSASEYGIGEDELASILSHRVTVGIAGKSSSFFGALPGFYVHLAGADGDTAGKLLSIAQQNAALGLSKTEEFSRGKWKGVRATRWSPVQAYAAASDEGFVIAVQDSGGLGRAPDAAPEIERAIEDKHRFVFAVDTRTLLDSVDSAIGALGSLFLKEKRQREIKSAFSVMKAFGCVTFVADNLSEGDAELFVSQPEFGRLLDDAAEKIALTAPAPQEQQEEPELPSAEEVSPPEPAPEGDETFASAAARFTRIFPGASVEPREETASAIYDGKPVTMTVARTPEGGALIRFASETSSSLLNIGPDRAERLVRRWREVFPSSACELRSERNGDETDIELSLTVPVSQAASDADFTSRADRFLAALDGFYDLLAE